MQEKFFSGPSLLRCLLLSSASVFLFCLGLFIPVLGMAASVFSPTPIALLGARENKTWMALGLLGVTLMLWLALGWGFAVSFLLSYGLLGFGLTLPLGKLEKGSEGLLFCVVISIVSKVLFIAVSVMLTGSNPFEMDPDALRGMFNMGGEGGQESAYLQESIAQVAEILPYLVPFSIILYSAFESFLNYKLCEVLQRKREGEVKFAPLPPFGEWRFSSSLIYVLVFVFLLPFLTEESGRLWIMLEYNLKFLVNIFFFIQGLALVWWWLSKYSSSHYLPLPLRVVLLGFLALPVTWMAALGFGDMCFDFRTKKMRRA